MNKFFFLFEFGDGKVRYHDKIASNSSIRFLNFCPQLVPIKYVFIAKAPLLDILSYYVIISYPIQLLTTMYSYSSSSMSIYGRNTRKAVSTNNNYPRDEENQSSIANRAVVDYGSPKRTPKKAPVAPTTPPRSPFVTPNHPLYVFGDDQFNNTNLSEEFEPPAPQKTKNCLDSMQEMSISSPPREDDKPSPFRKLQLSNAFVKDSIKLH